MTLVEYIEKHYNGNKAEFAKAEGTTRQHVQKWVKNGWLVMGRQLVSPKKELSKPAK